MSDRSTHKCVQPNCHRLAEGGRLWCNYHWALMPRAVRSLVCGAFISKHGSIGSTETTARVALKLGMWAADIREQRAREMRGQPDGTADDR